MIRPVWAFGQPKDIKEAFDWIDQNLADASFVSVYQMKVIVAHPATREDVDLFWLVWGDRLNDHP